MHEELRIDISMEHYRKAFRDWVRIKTNNNKLSIEFDKEIGIGEWKKTQIDEHKKIVSAKIKDKNKFIIAKLKYEL